MGRVVNLFVAVAHRQPMRELHEVIAVAEKGFQGCIHGRTGSRRQVLLMDVETLAGFGLAPGIVRENITTEGVRLEDVKEGQRLHIGETLLEVTVPCEPCSRMDEIRMGLQDELRGRRGMMCRVIEGGVIHRGDSIEVLEPAAAICRRAGGES
jgi:MOSC domain-containing protein YiiM